MDLGVWPSDIDPLTTTQWNSSVRKEAQLHHALVEEETVRDCIACAGAARVESLYGEVRFRCTDKENKNALLKAQKEGESLAPFWPQRPPCPCTGLRELAERIHVLQHDRAFLRQPRPRYQCGGFRRSQSFGSRCPFYLEPKKKKEAEEEAEEEEMLKG